MKDIIKRRARRVAPHEVEESQSILASAGLEEALPDNARVQMREVRDISFEQYGAAPLELSADDKVRIAAWISAYPAT